MAVSSVSDRRFIEVNAEFLDTLGFSREEVIGKTAHDLNLFFDDEIQAKVLKTMQKDGQIKNIELKVRKKNGQIIDGLFSGEMIDNQLEKAYLTVMVNITDIKRAERDLRTISKRLALATRAGGVGVWDYDIQNNILVWDDQMYKLYGIKKDSFKAGYQTWKDGLHPDDFENSVNEMQKAISGEKEFDTEFRICRPDGSVRNIRALALVERDESGKPLRMIGTNWDITENKQKQDEIELLSYYDHLTGLFNRRFYEKEMERLDDEKHLPLSLVMVDVNGLKLANDAFGHKTGDMLLQKIAAILRKECHENDIVARVGGDEFVLLFPQTDAERTEMIMNRIYSATTKEQSENVVLSISMGYAIKRNNSEHMSDVFIKADDNMYKHKLAESLSMRRKTIHLIMNSLIEKSEIERTHSKKVGEICVSIAKEMGLVKNEVSEMELAGQMHDIGKIGIDEAILKNTGILTAFELNELQRHSEIGYRILNSVGEFSRIANFILEHHEKYDGTGYPKGLKGNEISLQARIITVADAYDKMTSDTIYSKKWSEDEAVNELIKFSGTKFDPEIVNVFIKKVLKKD
jgi:diguanylate cyclase (GGDEF)-like protein/PAS domain S-box-containing protein